MYISFIPNPQMICMRMSIENNDNNNFINSVISVPLKSGRS